LIHLLDSSRSVGQELDERGNTNGGVDSGRGGTDEEMEFGQFTDTTK